MYVSFTYAGIPPLAADDEIQDAHVAPEQYVVTAYPVYADGTLCISILVRVCKTHSSTLLARTSLATRTRVSAGSLCIRSSRLYVFVSHTAPLGD